MKKRKKKEKYRQPWTPPIRVMDRPPGRNMPCPCGSGLKLKKCCGKPVKQPPKLQYQTFASQYTPEQQRAVQGFLKRWGFNPNPAQLKLFMEEDHAELKRRVIESMRAINTEQWFIDAVEECDMLVTPKNRRLLTDEDVDRWEAAVEAGKCRQEKST